MIVMIFIMTKITVQILHDYIMYLTKTGLEKNECPAQSIYIPNSACHHCHHCFTFHIKFVRFSHR